MKLRSFLSSMGGAAALSVACTAPAIAAGGSVVPGTTFAASSSEQRASDGAYSLVATNGGYGYSNAANALVGVTYDALSKGYLYSGLASGPRYLRVSGSGWFGNSASSSQYGARAYSQSSAFSLQDYAMLLAGLGIVGMVIRRRSHGF
jgi:hypothetical protein